ncbi:MAG: hypothetical protein ACFFER_12825 [Candidatus Thorarchaeota archaeon]
MSRIKTEKLMKRWIKARLSNAWLHSGLLGLHSNYALVSNSLADYLTMAVSEKLGPAVEVANSISRISESWLSDAYKLKSRAIRGIRSFTSSQWKWLQNTLLESSDDIERIILSMLESSEGQVRVMLLSILDELRTIIDKKPSLESMLESSLEDTAKIFEQAGRDFGEVACGMLYAECCTGIPWQGKKPRSPDQMDSKCVQLKMDLRKSLAKSDVKQARRIANSLKRTARKAAVIHSEEISHLQRCRTEPDYEDQKVLLIRDELGETRLMKQRGLDYATGLYYHNLLRAGMPKKDIEKECTEAQALPFDAEEDWKTIGLHELQESHDKYDGKMIQVGGQVSYLREKKSRSKGREVVFTILKLQDASSEIEAYYPRYWLSDNGLCKTGYAEVVGVFNKICPDAKRPDLHMIRLGLAERAERDWQSRCQWLVRDWWDGFTDRTPAEWTMGKMDPNTSSFSNESSTELNPREMEISSDQIESAKKKYPSLSAGLRAVKHQFGSFLQKSAKAALISAISQIVKTLAIESLTYLAASSQLAQPFSAQMPILGVYTDGWGYYQYEVEVAEMDLSRNLDWLPFQLPSL